MNCRRVQSSLAEDLRDRADERIAAHLEECRVCRAVCRDLLEIERLSRGLGVRFKAPDDFREEVLGKLSRERFSRPFRLGAALAAAILLAIAIGLFRGGESPDGASLEAGSAFEAASPRRAGTGEPAYVDVVVTVDGDEDLILRLPSVIEIRRTELQEDFHIVNVSH